MGFPGAKIIPQLFAARERGVILDLARGAIKGFRQMQAAVEAGVLPDTLSTDLTIPSAVDPDYTQMMLMTQLLSFGVSLEECLKCVTVNPAQALGRSDSGNSMWEESAMQHCKRGAGRFYG